MFFGLRHFWSKEVNVRSDSQCAYSLNLFCNDPVYDLYVRARAYSRQIQIADARASLSYIVIARAVSHEPRISFSSLRTRASRRDFRRVYRLIYLPYSAGKIHFNQFYVTLHLFLKSIQWNVSRGDWRSF